MLAPPLGVNQKGGASIEKELIAGIIKIMRLAATKP